MLSRLQPINGLSEIAGRFPVLFVDQFGTMHDGQQPYPRAAEALARYRRDGGRVIVLSNSAKSGADNRGRLHKFGFDERHFDHVVTSGDATQQAILDGRLDPVFAPGACIHISGKIGDDYGFGRMGFRPVSPDNADGIILAASQEPDRPWQEQVREMAVAARRHVPVLVCNPDLEMLTPAGVRPSAGFIGRELAKLGAQVTTFGKPLPYIYQVALDWLGNPAAEDVLAIGDSPEHDLEGALAIGANGALVRTGIMAGLEPEEIAPRAPGHGVVTFLLSELAW